MKQLFVATLLLLASTVVGEQIMGQHCGTRGTMLGTIASDTLIPDYFPPENFLLRLILANPMLVDLRACETELPRVHLGASCIDHDRCYRTLGANKDSCDIDLIDAWRNSCDQTYSYNSDTSDMCNSACHAVTELMYAGLRFDDGNWCPSCEAFERDQKWARDRMR